MATLHSTPSTPPGQPCWHCTHFLAMAYAGTAARCGVGGRTRIEAAPATGCAFWVREPGTDDEPGPPGGHAELARKPRVDVPATVRWAR